MVDDDADDTNVSDVSELVRASEVTRAARPTTKLHKAEILGAQSRKRAAPPAFAASHPDFGSIVLGKYRIDSLIGTGGMSVVLKAHHLDLDEPVAMKLLHADMVEREELVERFLREARSSVKLKGEHICRVFDLGKLEDGTPYLVMEYLEGADVDSVLTQGAFEPAHAIDLFLQACEALAEAHAQSVVHRDIKPSNLFLTELDRVPPILKVLDFGLATAPQGSELTGVHTVLGTPSYMSPEQMRSAREVDTRSDIWSLGVVLYEMLEARRPFRANGYADLCLKVGMEPAEPMTNARVPERLRAVITKCLAKTKDERFQSVAELANEVAPFAHDKVRAKAAVENCVRILRRSTPSVAELPRRSVVSTYLGVGPDPTAELRAAVTLPAQITEAQRHRDHRAVNGFEESNRADSAHVAAVVMAPVPQHEVLVSAPVAGMTGPFSNDAPVPPPESLIARLAAVHAMTPPVGTPVVRPARTAVPIVTEAVAPLPRPPRKGTEPPRDIAIAAEPRRTRSRFDGNVIAGTILAVVGIGIVVLYLALRSHGDSTNATNEARVAPIDAASIGLPQDAGVADADDVAVATPDAAPVPIAKPNAAAAKATPVKSKVAKPTTAAKPKPPAKAAVKKPRKDVRPDI